MKKSFILIQTLFYFIILSFLAKYLQGSLMAVLSHQQILLEKKDFDEVFNAAKWYAQDDPEGSCQNISTYEEYFSQNDLEITLSCQAVDLFQTPGLYAIELKGRSGTLGQIGFIQRKEQWFSVVDNH
jgi:hypothetical protein